MSSTSGSHEIEIKDLSDAGIKRIERHINQHLLKNVDAHELSIWIDKYEGRIVLYLYETSYQPTTWLERRRYRKKMQPKKFEIRLFMTDDFISNGAKFVSDCLRSVEVRKRLYKKQNCREHCSYSKFLFMKSKPCHIIAVILERRHDPNDKI